MADQLKDSGLRTIFETGATRETRDPTKGRYDLVPAYPHHRLAVHYAKGALKYADRQWEKGLPLSTFVDSLQRHLLQWLQGDRSEDHLAAVTWNVYGLMWTERKIEEGKLPLSLNDLPDVQIASLAHAVEAIRLMREKSPEQLVEQTGAHRQGGGALPIGEAEDLGYPKEAKDAVAAVLGKWEDHAPYTDLAEYYIYDRQQFDILAATEAATLDAKPVPRRADPFDPVTADDLP